LNERIGGSIVTRVSPTVVAVVLSVSVISATTPQPAPRDAVTRLAKARAAMGGEAALAAVKTLTVKILSRGRIGGPATAGKPPVYDATRTTIQVLFPDHYLASSEGTDMSEMSRATGWTIPSGQPGSEGFAGATDIGTRAMRAGMRERFGYLMLQLLLATDTAFPFTLRRVAGDTLYFTDLSGVPVSIDLDPATNLPLRWRYEPVGVTNPMELAGRFRPRRIEIADWRRVGALRLPHKFTTFYPDMATMLREEQIESIVLNPKLTKADFK
jgi:hypothetical protein